MRLIDLDNHKVKYLLGNLEECGEVTDELLNIAEEEPVDAVQIVRCRECIHRYVDGENVLFNRCELNHNFVQADDWYCADGEMREEEEYNEAD